MMNSESTTRENYKIPKSDTVADKKKIPFHTWVQRRAKGDVVVHTIDGCRKLVCNMTLLVNNSSKEVFIIDSGRGLEDISSNVPVVTKAILEKARTRRPDYRALLQYHRKGYTIIGFLITHIHGDHIGSFSDCKDFLEDAGIKLNFKIYGSRVTYVYGSMLTRCSYFKNNFEVISDRQLKVVSEQFKFYPIQVNHSAPQTMSAYFKIADKTILYLCDFKMDFDPILGVSQQKLHQFFRTINETAPDGLVIESTCVSEENRPNVSEAEVASTLKKHFLYNNEIKDSIIITTFATNAARLLSIIKATVAINRKVAIYGRSMCNAINAYLESQLIPPHYRQFIVFLDTFTPVNKNKKGYVILCTGHQGEPNAALSRMVNDQLGFRWSKNDLVIFSSNQIPAVNAQISRNILLCQLKQRRVEVIDRIHCSGHVSKAEATRVLRNLDKCKKYIVNHGDYSQMLHYYDILDKLGICDTKLVIGRNDFSYAV